MGFGFSREDVSFSSSRTNWKTASLWDLDSLETMLAFRLLEQTGRPHPFNNGMAGGAWIDVVFFSSTPKTYPSYCPRSAGLNATKVIILNWGAFIV